MRQSGEAKKFKNALAMEKEKVRRMGREITRLEKENGLQRSVLESLEEVNTILVQDPQGKKLSWLDDFPHNLSPETARKVQEVLKKTLPSGGGSSLLPRFYPVPGKE